MKEKLLAIDAIFNFILGILLLLAIPFSSQMTEIFGVPTIDQAFYPSIMGAVFIGIGISLIIEINRNNAPNREGLGLTGAATINLCGGSVLLGWLLFGNLDLPTHGSIFLWIIAIFLVSISAIELITQNTKV